MTGHFLNIFNSHTPLLPLTPHPIWRRRSYAHLWHRPHTLSSPNYGLLGIPFKTESEWWVMEKIGLICICLSILTLCILLNSPFSKIISHFPQMSAKYTKCFNIFAIILHLSERTHILTKPHHHLKLSLGSEIKAESFLSLQYNINNKCRITEWTLHRKKKRWYTISGPPPLDHVGDLGIGSWG